MTKMVSADDFCTKLGLPEEVRQWLCLRLYLKVGRPVFVECLVTHGLQQPYPPKTYCADVCDGELVWVDQKLYDERLANVVGAQLEILKRLGLSNPKLGLAIADAEIFAEAGRSVRVHSCGFLSEPENAG